MSNPKQSLGRWGEKVAAAHLAQKDYAILEMNTRTPYGEIDLIASKDGVIVFVEVKTRTSATFGLPEESINQRKQAHILSSAEHYIQQHPETRELLADRCDIHSTFRRQPPTPDHPF
jgi:putative endonuclease